MISLIYTTINNEEDAKKIANYLVDEQIVACVNIIPNVQSIYRWKGKIEEEREFLLIAKTVDENVLKAINKIKKFHNYDIPDIISIPINNGYSEYLDYIKRETE